MTSTDGKPLFSIGHSNHELERFLGMLEEHRIEVLVDVRSYPYCRYATQFNAEPLKVAVVDSGIKYLPMGHQVGGMPRAPRFFDSNGQLDYRKVAAAPEFLEGIMRIERGRSMYRVALMCAEENPTGCHRHKLIGHTLTERGVELVHIRANGQLQTDAELRAEIIEAQKLKLSKQKLLFSDSDDRNQSA